MPHNMIVFCDGCNTPYHQYCHDPPIEDEVVKVEEKEWLCVECLGVRKGSIAVGGATGAVGVNGVGDVDLRTAVSGEGLSPDEVSFAYSPYPPSTIPSIVKGIGN